MGDLGVRNSGRPRSTQQSDDGKSKALAVIGDKAPDVARGIIRGAMKCDQVLDKVPVVGFVTPEKPSGSERFASGAMAVVYLAAAGASFIPFVGSTIASVAIAAGGAAARFKSQNPEVQNQGNLALQTSVYGATAGMFGFGMVPYARAAIKSALIALNKG